MALAANTVSTLTSGARRISKRLVASYILDWFFIAATAAVGGGFTQIDGARHAFSLQDPNISFPYHEDTVSVPVLIVVVLIAPGVITALISLLFIPGPTAHKSTAKALVWRRKIWEWNAAWMGLGIALAGAFVITEGIKIASGKPRPFLLDVCDPDLSQEAIASHRVGGLGSSVESAVPILVDWHICRNTDRSKMRNAFASFPSGHSSFSWAGMLYLTFFLSAKFAVQIPFLPHKSESRQFISTFDEEDVEKTSNDEADSNRSKKGLRNPPRNEAAAPPVYLLILTFVPIGVAIYISVSRWYDYRHHGFDIICGSIIGIFTAWFGFRWYHLPIRTGSGWAWGARSRDRAFWLGVGRQNYVGEEGWESAGLRSRGQDFEEKRSTVNATGPTDQGLASGGRRSSETQLP